MEPPTIGRKMKTSIISLSLFSHQPHYPSVTPSPLFPSPSRRAPRTQHPARNTQQGCPPDVPLRSPWSSSSAKVLWPQVSVPSPKTSSRVLTERLGQTPVPVHHPPPIHHRRPLIHRGRGDQRRPALRETRTGPTSTPRQERRTGQVERIGKSSHGGTVSSPISSCSWLES